MNRKRLGLAVLSGTVALAAGVAAPASAGVPPGTTAVEVIGSGPGGGDQTVFLGRVTASPPKCSRARTVELQLSDGSAFQEVDTGTSSRRGYFALGVPNTMGSLRVVALPKRIDTKDGKVKCQRAVDNLGS